MKFSDIILALSSFAVAFGLPSDFAPNQAPIDLRPEYPKAFGAGRQYQATDDTAHWVVWSGDVTKNEANCSSIQILDRSKGSILCEGNNFALQNTGFKFQQCRSDGNKLPELLVGDEQKIYTCGNVISGPPLACRGQRPITLFTVCKSEW